jgi:hypothetical protein
MATYIVDASALLKRYRAEEFTQQVNAVLDDNAHQKLALEITLIEALRSLHSGCNKSNAPREDRHRLVARLSADVQTGLITVLEWDSVYALNAQVIAEDAMLDHYANGKPSPVDLAVAGCALQWRGEARDLRVLSCDGSLNQLLGHHGVPTEPPMP